VQERPPRPAPPPPAEAAAPPPQPAQSVAIPRPVAPSPSPPGPVVSAGYRAALSAWLQEHKRYPESARERGEQGEALLRFRVDRSGRVLSFAVVRSSGYPDLDAAVEGMMRGAELPPFPSEMTAADIQVSLTIRFGLSR
jgi:protein TonB